MTLFIQFITLSNLTRFAEINFADIKFYLIFWRFLGCTYTSNLL